MNTIVRTTARLLVEACQNASEHDVPALCDAAVQFLAAQGVSPRKNRAVLSALRQEVQKHGVLPVHLRTPSGESGTHRKTLASTLEKALKRTVEIDERAQHDLIGGAHLSFGDERIDGSLRGALEQLGSHLTLRASSLWME